jgi:hypothetical protein
MCVACQAYLAPAELAKVQTSDLAELSGLAIGHQNPQLIFAHNDRARAVVFVLDRQGGVKARLSLENAMPTDVEDIAIAACAKDSRDSCVYLADIGDNASQRSEIAVLRFAEPALPASDAVTMLSPMFTRLRFRYEDGAHNAEGFMVDPATARMYVVTKLMDGGVSSVYRLDEGASADAVGTAVKVAALPVPMSSDMSISAAAAQPCGGGFVVRTYNTIYEFRIPVGMPFEQAFSVAPVTIAAPTENQSEAIDYLPDGRGLVTSGEGASAAIFEMRCEP